jgi:ferredoxin
MPIVRYQGRDLPCEHGARLRDVLIAAGEVPHNGNARLFNCRGIGTCGTCAVAITGPVSEPNARERWRLSIPPHDAVSGLRLACHVRVLGDLVVEKYAGFWGQRIGTPAPTD